MGGGPVGPSGAGAPERLPSYPEAVGEPYLNLDALPVIGARLQAIQDKLDTIIGYIQSLSDAYTRVQDNILNSFDNLRIRTFGDGGPSRNVHHHSYVTNEIQNTHTHIYAPGRRTIVQLAVASTICYLAWDVIKYAMTEALYQLGVFEKETRIYTPQLTYVQTGSQIGMATNPPTMSSLGARRLERLQAERRNPN